MTSALTTKLKRWQAIKADSEREIMRANLLRAVSHDLRTPLTSIYGACSALLEDADQISPQQQEKLLEKLQQVTGKKVELQTKVDPACMGGIRLDYDGKRVDGTVKNRLDSLRNELMR